MRQNAAQINFFIKKTRTREYHTQETGYLGEDKSNGANISNKPNEANRANKSNMSNKGKA